jgi:hypothetical protein
MIDRATPTAVIETPGARYGEELLYSAYVGGQIVTQEDTLRIGIGDVRYGDFVDDKGQTLSGRIATVAIFVRDHPELDRGMEVYEGQTFTVTEHRIRVTDVDVDTQMIVLKIATQIE